MAISTNAVVERYRQVTNMSFGEVQEWFRQADAQTIEARRQTAERTMAVLRKRPEEYTAQDFEHMSATVQVVEARESGATGSPKERSDWLSAFRALGHDPEKRV